VSIGPCKFFADCGPSHTDRPDEAVMAGLAPILLGSARVSADVGGDGCANDLSECVVCV